MQKLPAIDKVKNIGVCNVQLVNLEKLLDHKTCKTGPAVNQIEVNKPFLFCLTRLLTSTSYTQTTPPRNLWRNASLKAFT